MFKTVRKLFNECSNKRSTNVQNQFKQSYIKRFKRNFQKEIQTCSVKCQKNVQKERFKNKGSKNPGLKIRSRV